MSDHREHLLALLEDRPSPEAWQWVRERVRAWLLSGQRGALDADGRRLRRPSPSLARCLGMPSTPEPARLRLRDEYLYRLAQHVEAEIGPHPWRIAVELARMAQRFELRKWPAWWRLDEAPEHASELERLLFEARRIGGVPLPSTPRRYRQLLEGRGR